MVDLIDRNAVIQTLGAFMAQGIEQGFGDAITMLKEIISETEGLPAIRPQIVANITGGVLQGASSNAPAEIYALDFELSSFDEGDTGILIDGSMAYLGQCSCKIDPDFVNEVIEAPERFIHNRELVEQ